MKPAMTQAERDVVVFAMSQMADLSDKDWRDHGFRQATFERAGQKIRNYMDEAVRPAPPPSAAESKPVAWRAWFDADNGARWLFTLWPDEERLEVDWQPLYAIPPSAPKGEGS
jgi:hypothetical protein